MYILFDVQPLRNMHFMVDFYRLCERKKRYTLFMECHLPPKKRHIFLSRCQLEVINKNVLLINLVNQLFRVTSPKNVKFDYLFNLWDYELTI